MTDLPTPTPPERRRSLLRVLGVTFGLAVTVGNTIGAGILRTPGDVAQQLPDVGWYLAVWIAGGLYALLGAVSMAELGTMLPRSGGMYVFARHALGPYAGFVVGWNDWIATCGSAAAVAVVIGEYLGVLATPLAGKTAWIAAAAILGFAALQLRGVRSAGLAQTLTSAAKALVLLALVAACFLLPASVPAAAAAAPALPAGAALLAAVVVAMQGVIYTYDGWTGVIYFSGEVRDPARDIPRAMFGGVLAVIAIYLLLNLAFLHVLPVPVLAGEEFAAGAAARAVLGAGGDAAVRIIVIVALLSSVNALVLMGPRVLWAMARDGLLSGRAAAVSEGGTPTGALAASVVVALLFAATGTFNAIIAVLAFFFVANYVIAFTAVFVLRRREPDTPRPYRAWGYPWTTGLALAGSLAFLAGAVAGDTRNSLYALAVLAASWPVYLLSRRLMRDSPHA
ncbi:MAG TPA: APC family permease [Longimicrobiaceae bacterium]|nr:APC family permease [Longimicrobiaceae bacterium]